MSTQQAKINLHATSKDGEQYILNWIKTHKAEYTDFLAEIAKIENGEDSELLHSIYNSEAIPEGLFPALAKMFLENDSSDVDRIISENVSGEALLAFDLVNNTVMLPNSGVVEDNGPTIVLTQQFPDVFAQRLLDSGLRRNLTMLSFFGMLPDSIDSIEAKLRKAITVFLVSLPTIAEGVGTAIQKSCLIQCAYYFIKFDHGFNRGFAFIMGLSAKLLSEKSEAAGLLSFALPSLVGGFAKASIAECFGDKEQWAGELDNIQDYETKKELLYAVTQTEGRKGRRTKIKSKSLPEIITGDVEDTLAKIMSFRDTEPDCDIAILYEALLASKRIGDNISLDYFLTLLQDYDKEHPFTRSGVTRKHKNLFHLDKDGNRVIKPQFIGKLKNWTSTFIK